MLGVYRDTITHWEWNEHEPTVQYASRIIAFLGYFPFSFETAPLDKQLYYARLITGKLQVEVAKEIGCDHTSLCRIEQGLRKPYRRMREKIQGFVNAATSEFLNPPDI